VVLILHVFKQSKNEILKAHSMIKFLKFCLLFVAWLPIQAATAADFAIKDLSGEQSCISEAFVEALRQTFPEIGRCSSNPIGTVEVIITPEPGELPIQCHEYEERSFCMYSADIYMAAHYQGQWLAKTGYVWTPVDLAKLQPTSHWGPWGGTSRQWSTFYVADLDLNTGRHVPPPEGFEVYVGIAPPGGPNFTLRSVAKIWPVAK